MNNPIYNREIVETEPYTLKAYRDDQEYEIKLSFTLEIDGFYMPETRYDPAAYPDVVVTAVNFIEVSTDLFSHVETSIKHWNQYRVMLSVTAYKDGAYYKVKVPFMVRGNSIELIRDHVDGTECEYIYYENPQD